MASSPAFTPSRFLQLGGGGQDGVDVEAAVVVPADDFLLLLPRDTLKHDGL